MTVTQTVATAAAEPGARTRADLSSLAIRTATPDDAPAIYALVASNLEQGHLLPRAIDDLVAHASRFLVLVSGAEVVGCGEVAPLSRTVAEIRSLVVDTSCRGRGLGSRLVDALKLRARAEGHCTLCAFAHQPASFVRQGFSIVPHVWLPEKIATDCHACPLFRRCGQYAVSFSLDRLGRRLEAPAASAREAHA